MNYEKPDLVLKNANIINVFTQEIDKGDIAICDDKIVGIGSFQGKEEIDCTGLYVSPGFIDAHVHIESSMVIPSIFSQLVIEKGITTVIADPHEIANVLGVEGINFMLENSNLAEMDIFFMLPSCVPATSFEDNGACLDSEKLYRFKDNKRVLGLGEVMDVPAVINGDFEMLKKIEIFKDKIIDGHCPGISQRDLNVYLSRGIKTDHECADYKEALNKVNKGMYVMLREGSACRNLKDILPAVNEKNYRRFLFCTDDKHINDIIEEGTIDNAVRLSIREGLKPIIAFTIGSYNAAVCYNLKDRGAVAPGYLADLLVFEDLDKIKIKKVIKKGKVYRKKEYAHNIVNVSPSMKVEKIKEDNFKIKANGEDINIIKVVPYSVETRKTTRKAEVQGDYLKEKQGEDILKVAVFERHKNTGKFSVGFIEGLGLKNCSIAQTISHDSHNIIVVGDSDKDMTIAVNTLIDIGGGIILVSEGKLLGTLPLPIAGLMTDKEPYIVSDIVNKLNIVAKQFGTKEEFDAFLTLGFMSLPVIPDIKITPRGLFDYKKFDFIELFN